MDDAHGDAGPRGAASAPPEVGPSSPQAPPASWSADHEGPGSPRGSIRPPDVTGTYDPPVPAVRASGRRLAVPVVAGIIGAIIGTLGTWLALQWTGAVDVAGAPAPAPVFQTRVGEQAGSDGNVAVAVAEAVTPSVVRIDVSRRGATSLGADAPAGIGSGVIYRADGYILTNHHVVQQGGALEVRFADGRTARGEVIGSDPLNDLAVVAVDRRGLPAVTLRSDPPLRVGETAIAIGSPFGLEASVTAGVVSAVNRQLAVPAEITGDEPLFIPAVVQTDAAINPGNSGGALVDADGRLVGINTAIFSESGGSQGVGFAIPVRSAAASAEELIEHGVVRHAFLGVSGQDVTRDMARRLRLDRPQGALLDVVVDGSGAARAGLEPGDVVTAVDGEPIADMAALIVAVRAYAPGDTVTVTVNREGQARDVDVALSERPSE